MSKNRTKTINRKIPFKSLRYALLVSSCFGLSGCLEALETPPWIKPSNVFYEDMDDEDASSKPSEISPEDLLDAEGEWTIIEQSEEYDPSEAHMEARGNVDPRRRKRKSELAAHFEPDAKSGKDHQSRVLVVDADRKPVLDEGKSSGFFGQFKDLFSDEDEGVKTPQPPKKPVVTIAASPPPEVIVSSIITPPDLPARKLKDIPKPQLNNPRTSVDQNVLAAVVAEETHLEEAISWQAPPPPKSSEPITTPPAELEQSLPVPAVKPKFAAPASASVTKQAAAKTQQADTSTKTIFNIRNGRHPGKTRLALDISGFADFKTQIDPIRNVLRIKILNADWGIEPQGKLMNSSLLGSYVAKEIKEDNSIMLEIRLRRTSKILTAEILPPSTTKYHRIMIDLAE